MTPFQEKVYYYCKKVPKGKVTSYKEIAKAMKTKAYRAVGTALNKNPYAPKVPCHRVINHDGSLGGFATGLKNKIKMLKDERVIITNGKIDRKYFFRFKQINTF
ncbi:MGMT family protein [Candidatus Woesearchaeota archaeon]|nr:MAG: MGMT family protein [Candidatus Woesearchaeota archaeon]